MAKTPKAPHEISVVFNKVSLRADGEVCCLLITQADQEINLTAEQAATLAAQINTRLKGKP